MHNSFSCLCDIMTQCGVLDMGRHGEALADGKLNKIFFIDLMNKTNHIVCVKRCKVLIHSQL